MKIETPRLILREMCDDDFEKLYEIFSDAETMKYYPHTFDEAKVRQWIEWNQQYYESYNMGLLAVTLKEISMGILFLKSATTSIKTSGIAVTPRKLPSLAGIGLLKIRTSILSVPI